MPSRPGFSLIELIVVIAILAVVVVIAMGDYGFAAKQARLQVTSEELLAALEEARVNSQTSAGFAGAGGEESAPRCWGITVGTDSTASLMAWGFDVEAQACAFGEVVSERAVSVDAQVQLDEIRTVSSVGEGADSSLSSIVFVFTPPDGVLSIYDFANLSSASLPLSSLQQVQLDLSYQGSSNEALQRTLNIVPATATFDMI